MPTIHRNEYSGEWYLPAVVLQVVGLILLISAAVFWAVTGRESALLMSASMSLILLGAYRSALNTLRRSTDGVARDDEEH
jgi:membrane protein implicated in regulation of membrane protease activity